MNSRIILEHIVSEKGIKVDKAKVKLISKLPILKPVQKVRSLLGYAEFYRCFIKNFSKIFKPLYDLLEKDVLFEFTPFCLAAFERLKTELTSVLIIRPPH